MLPTADPMARPREFDADDVLDSAMQLFWNRGYEGTSINDLVEHTGLSRASLYNAFGGKRDLFLAAIKRYRFSKHQRLIDFLGRPGPARATIKEALEQVASDVLDCGCFITNTAVEFSQNDPEVVRRVNASWKALEDAFEVAVARGQEQREIARRFPSRRIARFLVGSVQGLGVLGRAGNSRVRNREVAAMAMAALD